MNTTKNVLAAKILSIAALATAFALAPTTANAQVSFGVRIGQPAYIHVDPRYPRAPFPPDRFYYNDARRDRFLREQAWQRDHRYDDRRDFDRRHFDDRYFDDHRGW